MNGVNPFLITSIAAIPDNFPVTDEVLRGVLPPGVTLAQLLDQRRLFLCDWKDIAGVADRLRTFPGRADRAVLGWTSSPS